MTGYSDLETAATGDEEMGDADSNPHIFW